MNRNIIIGIVVVAILAILGIWYFSSSTMPSVPAETSSTNTQTNVTPVKNTTTFRSIFAQSGNHQCSYEQVNPTSRSTSVVYIADGKMRGEFRTITATTSTANLMIYSGGLLYSWKEGAVTGKKLSITSVAELPEVIPSDLTSGAVYGTNPDNVSWDCHDWLMDAKLLTVPANIKF
ncbi:MAG: hypothetical protein V4467_00920 [Patescibacteria group bacterium]